MIKKFKTFEEARRDLWVMNPDAEYYKRLMEFYEFASRFSKRKHLRGIFKFKTIEEAQEHRQTHRY
ncbi:MAG: hypothetical protein Q8N03_06390 [Ignavibacteria bacterium]|nr:hypothetical protein [Ignavibacteria bacterium]